MIFHGELLAYKENNSYITYVFRNLDTNGYEMCTRLPNWDCQFLKIGDTGYIKTKFVQAGKDTWFDGEKEIFYKYTNIYFENFVPDKLTDKIIL